MSSRDAIELLSDKVGMVLLVLGGMHFFNLFVLSRLRKNSSWRRPVPPPPIAPDGMIPNFPAGR